MDAVGQIERGTEKRESKRKKEQERGEEKKEKTRASHFTLAPLLSKEYMYELSTD